MCCINHIIDSDKKRGCQQLIQPQYISFQLLQIEEFCKERANHFPGCCFRVAGVQLLGQV